MSVILVLGESGQLAREIGKVGAPEGFTLTFRGRREFDLSSAKSPSALIRETGASVVINAAGYTAVDEAERQPELAFMLNADSPKDVAAACAELGVGLVQISSDYVFDGEKGEPYVEGDERAPLNVYGQSKMEGEDVVLASGARCAILRTSWLYASNGTNFVRTMLRLAAEQDEVSVVGDQRGCPTWARDAAEGALLAARALSTGADLGVLHMASAGDATWADVAQAIFETLPNPPKLKVISSAEFGAPAKRPRDSRLDCARIAEVLGWQARPWRYSLAACLSEIEQGV